MAYKKYRKMKVYEASGYQYKQTPSIVLKGKWLSELGFDIGEQIEVKCENGRLIITNFAFAKERSIAIRVSSLKG